MITIIDCSRRPRNPVALVKHMQEAITSVAHLHWSLSRNRATTLLYACCELH